MELFHNHGSQARAQPAASSRRRGAAASIALVATGCAGGGSDGGSTSGSGGGGDQTITFLPKQLNNPYTDVVLGGGEDGAKAAGFTSTRSSARSRRAPPARSPSSTPTTQAGTNVIVIAANDPDAVCPVAEEARDGGAKIVAFDSDTNPDCRDVFISQVVAKDVALIQIEAHLGADRRSR